MPRRLLSSAVALVALSTGACVSTPDAVELQQEAERGPRLSESEARDALLSYVEMINAGLRGEGVEELAEVTSPGCSCRALVELVREGTAGGGAFERARFSADEVTVRSTGPGGAVVRARIEVTAYRVRSPDGLIVERVPADAYRADYTLRAQRDGWQVVQVTPVA